MNQSLQNQMQNAQQAQQTPQQMAQGGQSQVPQQAEAQTDPDKTGTINRDQTLKEEIVRRILYTEAADMSVGTDVVGTTTLNNLSVSFAYPGHGDAQYPVAKDGETRPWRFDWDEFSMRLKKGQTRYFIDDTAKLEGMGARQQDVARRRAAEALQLRKDENIMQVLSEGAVSENVTSLGAGEEWNADSGSDPISRLHDMWSSLLTSAHLGDVSVGTIDVILPVEIWTEMQKLEMIGNIQQQLQDYTERAYNFQFHPTNLGLSERHEYDMQDRVVMLIPGSDTAMHGTLSQQYAASRGVSFSDSWRNEAASRDVYQVTQWFNTGIMSHESATDGKTPRIAVEENVNVNSSASGT